MVMTVKDSCKQCLKIYRSHREQNVSKKNGANNKKWYQKHGNNHVTLQQQQRRMLVLDPYDSGKSFLDISASTQSGYICIGCEADNREKNSYACHSIRLSEMIWFKVIEY